MKNETIILDLSDAAQKRKLLEHIAALPAGLYEVHIKRRRKTRSLQQNNYYWVAIVSPWCNYLREQWGDSSITLEQAHDILKRAVLGVKELTNKETGEVLEITPTTTILDTEEFMTYVDNCSIWLQSFAGITALTSDLFYEKV